MIRKGGAAITVLLVTLLVAAAPAHAYDSGPHAELTDDALTTEGFGRTAVGVARVNNWFVDIYEQADSNPFTGHGGFWKRLLSGAVRTEHWPDELVAAAGRSHFDSSTSTLFNSAGVTNEWNRLRRAVWTLVREARTRNDPAELLAVLGMSLHQVQDFYTHTNWVEPAGGVESFDGPDWKTRGYGTTPTWFDVPAAARDAVTIYTANTKDHPRQHGDWNDDGNKSLKTTMAKDWAGRPRYTESVTAAYFASRQWIRAVRSWVGDDAFWARAQRYAADRSKRAQLAHDLRGALEISLYSGHWNGQGEPLGGERGPGGSLLDLRSAIKNYFQVGGVTGFESGPTFFRRRFEQLIRRMAAPDPVGEIGPVPSSQDLQKSERLIRLQVNYIKTLGLGDPGPDEADTYLRVHIAGQAYRSANIEGEDAFSFLLPNYPHTFLKAVPAVPNEGEPVESMEVEIRTADVRFAGTDDDVYLRVGPNLRFALDKRLYDDFERGDRDTYSVPIDEATRAGLRVGDIRQVQIEKSRDGVAGGWRLAGVSLKVNGRVLYTNSAVNRWLEDAKRTWRAPNFTPQAPRGAKVPVWIELMEEDSLYGGDDTGDINPFDRRRRISIGYAPGDATVVQFPTGGSQLGGRLGDGDRAKLRFRLETIKPDPIPPAPPKAADPKAPPETPPSTGKPDLVITEFFPGTITVKNQGAGAGGAVPRPLRHAVPDVHRARRERVRDARARPVVLRELHRERRRPRPGRRDRRDEQRGDLGRRDLLSQRATTSGSDPAAARCGAPATRTCPPRSGDIVMKRATARSVVPHGLEMHAARDRLQHDLELHQCERRPDAAAHATAERDPRVRGDVLLEPALGAEDLRVGAPELGPALDEVDARREHRADREAPAGDRERLVERAQHVHEHGPQAQRLLRDGLGVRRAAVRVGRLGLQAPQTAEGRA